MPQQILGWVGIILGVLFLFLGFAGAVREIVRNRVGAREFDPEAWAKLITALNQLISILATSPMWLACVLLGLLLIFLGSRVALPGANLLPGIGAG